MSFGAHRAASALRVLGSSSGSGGGVVAAVWTSLVTPFAAGPAVAGAFVAPNSRQLTVACVAGGAVARSQRRGRAAPRRSPLPQPSPPRPLADAQEVFFAESVQSFEDLGVSSPVAAALSAAGFARPSRVQELALPDILAGRDLVLAAETGSGKTLAYIAPLATLLLQRKEQKRLQAREHGDGAGTSHGRRCAVAVAVHSTARTAPC
jgi:DEAD/DEAH box helicase